MDSTELLRFGCCAVVLQGELCGVWQHDSCVAIQASQPLPQVFHCEMCRAGRADPFWRTVDGGLFPPSCLVPSGGAQRLPGDLVSCRPDKVFDALYHCNFPPPDSDHRQLPLPFFEILSAPSTTSLFPAALCCPLRVTGGKLPVQSACRAASQVPQEVSRVFNISQTQATRFKQEGKKFQLQVRGRPPQLREL